MYTKYSTFQYTYRHTCVSAQFDWHCGNAETLSVQSVWKQCFKQLYVWIFFSFGVAIESLIKTLGDIIVDVAYKSTFVILRGTGAVVLLRPKPPRGALSNPIHLSYFPCIRCVFLPFLSLSLSHFLPFSVCRPNYFCHFESIFSIVSSRLCRVIGHIIVYCSQLFS